MFSLAACMPFSLCIPARGADFLRFPYHPSPFVTTNPRDGLPDFTFFDANTTLGKDTIACPSELVKSCEAGHGGHDSKCTTDGSQACDGGLYCDLSHRHLVNNNLTEIAPHYVGAATKTKAIPRTRKNILQRAIGWLATHAPYFGCKIPRLKHDGIETCGEDDPASCPAYGYTLTCEGLVAMAFGSPKYGGDSGDSVQIKCADMQPGDSILFTQPSENGISHFQMFREWIVPGKVPRVYQMGGGHGSANMNAGTKAYNWCDDNHAASRKGGCQRCHKYAHLTDQMLP